MDAGRQSPAGGRLARVEDAFATVAHWALFVLLALVIVQVFTRYVLNDPFGEVVTITETYLMPAIVFFTIAALQRDDGHIRVDLLYLKFGGRVRQLADLLIFVLSAGFWAVVLYASANETLFAWRMGYEVSKNFPVPVASAIGVVPVGAALILVRLLLQIGATLRALRRPLPAAGAAA
jgi:TRAP-type C4-dicarboxylate transport system permease small subunit